MSDHRRFEILAATSIDFELSGAERAELARHVATCPECRRVSTTLQATAVRLRDRDRSIPPARLREAVIGESSGARLWSPALGLGAPAFSLLLILGLLLVALIAAGIGSGRFSALQPTASASPPPAGVIGAMIPIGAGAAAHAHACDFIVESDCATAIVAGFGSIWTTTSDSVARVDPATETVVATIPVGAFPHRLLVDGDALWVTVESPGALVRIDPVTNRVVKTIELGGHPIGVVDAFGYLWVTDALAGELLRVDPASDVIVQDRIAVGTGAWGVVAFGEDVWVTTASAGMWATTTTAEIVVRVNGTTGQIVARTGVGYAPRDIRVENGRLVIVDRDAILVVDPVSGQTSTVQALTFPSVVFDGRALWTASGMNKIVRWRATLASDPADDRSLVLPIEAGRDFSRDWELSVVVDAGSVWLRSYSADNVFRIDPVR